MSGKMRAVTISLCKKNKKKHDYTCQVYPAFNTVIIHDCNESDDVKEKIKSSAKWAVRNNLSEASVKIN